MKKKSHALSVIRYKTQKLNHHFDATIKVKKKYNSYMQNQKFIFNIKFEEKLFNFIRKIIILGNIKTKKYSTIPWCNKFFFNLCH